MSHGGPRATHFPPNGFALLEALVALCILAVGLLGSMALLLQSLRTSREALHHSVAVQLAGDLAERLRANRAALAAYPFDTAAEPAAVEPACSVGAACSPEDRARTDVAEWRQALTAALPQAAARLTPSDPADAAGAVWTIEVTWGGSGPDGGGTYTLQLRVRPE
jgi:type IV pilus assembly protein PilV